MFCIRNINGNDIIGNKITPIYLAVSIPEEITVEPLEYLIQKGANVNIQDVNGNTPLFFAFGARNQKGIEILRKAGADTSIRNKSGALFNEVMSKRVFGFGDKDGNVILQSKYYIDNNI